MRWQILIGDPFWAHARRMFIVWTAGAAHATAPAAAIRFSACRRLIGSRVSSGSLLTFRPLGGQAHGRVHRTLGPTVPAGDNPMDERNGVHFLRNPDVARRRPEPHDRKVMEVMRKDATAVPPVPFTGERALTELVRCRRHLDAAVESLELAVEIFSRLSGEADGPALGVFEELLGKREEAEAALRTATSPLLYPAAVDA